VQIHAYDNHSVHITSTQFRKGEEYRKIEEAALAGDAQATKTKAAIDGHVQAHYEQVNPQCLRRYLRPPFAPVTERSGRSAGAARPLPRPVTGGVGLAAVASLRTQASAPW